MNAINTGRPVGIEAPSIHVSIVNYNTWDDLSRCVQSLLRQEYPGHLRISVWNNGSSVPVDSFLDGRVEVGGEGRNLGFGAGHNRNLTDSISDLALLLNPDCVLPTGALRGLMRVWFGVRDVAAALAPQLRDPANRIERSCRRFPSLWTEMARAFALDRVGMGTVLRSWSHTGSGPVEQPPGAALLIPMSNFRSLGGFDEEFPLYFEDVDFCRRIWRQLGKIWFTDQVYIFHQREGTARKYRAKSVFWIEWSRRRYVRKHFPRRKILIAMVFGVVGVSLRAACFTLASLAGVRGGESRARAIGYRAAAASAFYGTTEYWKKRWL